MNIEHIAWQVQDPVAVTKWYGEQLGLTVLRQTGAPTFTHFLLDTSGKVVVEIYNNPKASVPDYPSLNPLHLHLAFSTDSPTADRDRLLKAGATIAEDLVTTPADDQLIMLRDPWGFALQLVKRKTPMLPL